MKCWAYIELGLLGMLEGLLLPMMCPLGGVRVPVESFAGLRAAFASRVEGGVRSSVLEVMWRRCSVVAIGSGWWMAGEGWMVLGGRELVVESGFGDERRV
jgi:hypothetical protein